MMTSAPAAIRPQRPAHDRYIRHLKRCEISRHGMTCWWCSELCRAADVEDGERFGWPETER